MNVNLKRKVNPVFGWLIILGMIVLVCIIFYSAILATRKANEYVYAALNDPFDSGSFNHSKKLNLQPTTDTPTTTQE